MDNLWYVLLAYGGIVTDSPRKSPLVFYRTASGSEPAREWLRELPEADRRAVGLDLMRVQYRWPVGMPLCRSLKEGLWEVRTSLPSRRISRVLFCAVGGELVVLHAFVKKTQKMPADELVIARARMRDLDR